MILCGMNVINAATVITNEGFTSKNALLPNWPNYGSNISSVDANWTVSSGLNGIVGTPDVALTWSSTATGSSGFGFDTFQNFTTLGNAIQMDGAGGGSQPIFSIVFTSSEGIHLDSFDLLSGNSTTKTVDWAVTGSSSGLLKSGSWTGTSDARDTIDVSVSGVVGESLTLEMTCVTGGTAYLGIDNIAFDQIPEPSSLSLGAVGVLLLILRKRR